MSTHKLFSYGTLQQHEVQVNTFGRLLNGAPDTLCGYVVDQIKITDQAVVATSGKEYHPILVATGNANDVVEGMVFDITDDELAHADSYEVDDYQRISETLVSGTRAWIYAAARE